MPVWIEKEYYVTIAAVTQEKEDKQLGKFSYIIRSPDPDGTVTVTGPVPVALASEFN